MAKVPETPRAYRASPVTVGVARGPAPNGLASGGRQAPGDFALVSRFVEKHVQRGVAPGDAELIGEVFEATQERLGDRVAGVLVVVVTEINPAAEGPRLAGGAKVLDLERAEVG